MEIKTELPAVSEWVDKGMQIHMEPLDT